MANWHENALSKLLQDKEANENTAGLRLDLTDKQCSELLLSQEPLWWEAGINCPGACEPPRLHVTYVENGIDLLLSAPATVITGCSLSFDLNNFIAEMKESYPTVVTYGSREEISIADSNAAKLKKNLLKFENIIPTEQFCQVLYEKDRLPIGVTEGNFMLETYQVLPGSTFARCYQDIRALPCSLALGRADDMLTYAESIVGVNLPRVHIRSHGVVVGAQQENLCFPGVYYNAGPGIVAWFCTDFKYSEEIRKMVLREDPNFNWSKESWLPNTALLQDAGIPIIKIEHLPGEIIHFCSGTVHWSHTIGRVATVNWNTAPLKPAVLHSSYFKQFLNLRDAYPPFICMKQLTFNFVATTNLELDLSTRAILKYAMMVILIQSFRSYLFVKTNNYEVVCDKEGVGKIQLATAVQPFKYCYSCSTELFLIYMVEKAQTLEFVKRYCVFCGSNTYSKKNLTVLKEDFRPKLQIYENFKNVLLSNPMPSKPDEAIKNTMIQQRLCINELSAKLEASCKKITELENGAVTVAVDRTKATNKELDGLQKERKYRITVTSGNDDTKVKPDNRRGGPPKRKRNFNAPCPYEDCSKRFDGPAAVRRHLLSHKAGTHKCEKCGFLTKTKQRLSLHSSNCKSKSVLENQ